MLYQWCYDDDYDDVLMIMMMAMVIPWYTLPIMDIIFEVCFMIKINAFIYEMIFMTLFIISKKVSLNYDMMIRYAMPRCMSLNIKK